MTRFQYRLTRGALLSLVLLVAPVSSQQPLDVFPDDAPLDAGFIRVGSWNLRHINLEEGARDFLAGANDAEDFAILTATFAKAIKDLGLDVIAIQEVQPRAGEPNRLHQIRDHLNNGTSGPWKAIETSIPYDDPTDPFGNLQFGLLWNGTKITVDPNTAVLLSDLRQPRNASGELTARIMRIPWLVPVKAGNFSFDLLVLHLKSGGDSPQAQEVNALEQFVRQRQTAAAARHLVICGDWNIRPDQSTGRARLRQMMAPHGGSSLMRVLTVDEIRPNLAQWEELNPIASGSAVAALVSYSHFNPPQTLDTFLDHLAISRTLDEVFDNPIEVKLAGGGTDLRPGIRVAVPLIPETSYIKLTDHLPVVLTLRTTATTPEALTPTGGLRISAAIPNPVGDDAQDEEVRIQNTGTAAVPLAAWKIGDSAGTAFWLLQATDGTVPAGGTVIVKRKNRPMALTNSGDTIVLMNPTGATVDQKTYGNAPSGFVFTFN